MGSAPKVFCARSTSVFIVQEINLTAGSASFTWRLISALQDRQCDIDHEYVGFIGGSTHQARPLFTVPTTSNSVSRKFLHTLLPRFGRGN